MRVEEKSVGENRREGSVGGEVGKELSLGVDVLEDVFGVGL